VYNTGHDNVGQEVADVAEMIVSAIVDDVIPGAGEIIDIAYGVISGLLDCDGPCLLVDGVQVYTGAFLFRQCFPNRTYPIGGRDQDNGNRYNSPALCRQSDYQFAANVTWIAPGGPGHRPPPREASRKR
jgi:hypothetical protein